jgi:predicted nuclease of restriction endonuclease-like (RecB) superfamily
VAVTVNAELTMLQWGIGRRIRQDVLGLEKPEYSRAVVERLAERLTARYGRGYSWSSLFRMMRFAAIYESREILAPLVPILTWSHFLQLIALADADERGFYEALASRGRWSKRELRRQIQRRLYQRSLGGTDAAALAAGLADIAGGDTAPELALRDPYVLDFLGLGSERSEADLERAIIDDMQRFLLELGAGFAFVARHQAHQGPRRRLLT